VGCRHHLLLDVTSRGGLRLNVPCGATRMALMPRASDDQAALFIDDAVEALIAMERTCSLDLADQGRAGKRRIGRALGASPQAATVAVQHAKEAMVDAMRRAGVEP
jgi:hypothetical protein